jgi:hypothetical protein
MKLCNVDHQYRVIYEKSVANLTPSPPPETVGVAMAARLAGSDIGQCLAACQSHDNKVCLDLQKSAVVALAPLGKFVQSVDDNPGTAQGVMMDKKDIITVYGGNPDKDEDPCVRSAVKRVGDIIENSGLECKVTTKALFPTSDFKTRLEMPTTLNGVPSNWSVALHAMLPTTPATLFPDKDTGPRIYFEGEDTDQLNNDFSGIVNAVSSVSKKQIVLATTNGCIQGYYER